MADFGENSQWLKGRYSTEEGVTYVNVSSINSIRKINADNYLIQCAGHRFKLKDCVWKENLTEIAPTAE